MAKTQQKTGDNNGNVISRQYLYNKGYTMSSACRALLLSHGIEISVTHMARICRGEAKAKPELVAAIKALPKVEIC